MGGTSLTPKELAQLDGAQKAAAREKRLGDQQKEEEAAQIKAKWGRGGAASLLGNPG